MTASDKNIKPLPWTNDDNQSFYELITVFGLQELAKRAGLDTVCDLEFIKPYWVKSKSILEVGAGYGRVIEYLLSHQYAGTITTIERSTTFFNYLTNLYHDNDQVVLVKNDLHHFNLGKQKFDLILWMWSGISDFSPLELEKIIQQLSQHLNPSGAFILECLPPASKPLDAIAETNEQSFTLTVGQCKVNIYNYANSEIDRYAKAAGLNNTLHKNYFTTVGRERVMHILRV